MPREEKRTVDYFPFYAKDGDTLFILEHKYQCKGSGFFTNVLRFLALTPDHHYCINNETKRMRFFATVKCDEKEGEEMLNIMATTGKIDKKLWENNKVIVSDDFLQSAKYAYKDRINEIISIEDIRNLYNKELKPDSKSPKPDSKSGFPPENQEGNTPVAGFPPEIRGRNTQIKLNKTKLNNNIEPAAPQQPVVISQNKTPACRKSDTKMNDPLAQHWQDIITSNRPDTIWGNWGKEKGQLTTLAKKTRELLLDTPVETETELADLLFAAFLELRQIGTDKLIRGSPVIPSQVAYFWPKITTYVAERWEERKQAEADFMEIPF